MIAAASLLGYAALLVAVVAPRLVRAAWPERAPRLAIAAWLALCASAVTSVVLAGVVLTVPAPRMSGSLAGLLAECEMALRAGYAHPGGEALSWAGGALAAAVAARTAWCAAGSLTATARAARRHSGRLGLAGRRDERLDAFVVDHGEPAAYCVPGSRNPVVLTTGALRLLDDAQVAAVLAHERAHLAGRHHLLVALAGVPARAFPWVPAFGRARAEVARLAELAADDAAARRSPRLTVAEALLALGTAPAAAPAPAGMLGAGGSGAADRVRRLITAPRPLSRAARASGTAGVAALVAVPLALLAVPVLAAVGMCCH